MALARNGFTSEHNSRSVCHLVKQDFLEIWAIDDTSVWQSVPLSEVGDSLENGVPGVSDTVFDAAFSCSGECKACHYFVEELRAQ